MLWKRLAPGDSPSHILARCLARSRAAPKFCLKSELPTPAPLRATVTTTHYRPIQYSALWTGYGQKQSVVPLQRGTTKSRTGISRFNDCSLSSEPHQSHLWIAPSTQAHGDIREIHWSRWGWIRKEAFSQWRFHILQADTQIPAEFSMEDSWRP